MGKINLKDASEVLGISLSGLSRRVSRGQYQGTVEVRGREKLLDYDEMMSLESRRGRQAPPDGYVTTAEVYDRLVQTGKMKRQKGAFELRRRFGLVGRKLPQDDKRVYFKMSDIETIAQWLESSYTLRETFKVLGYKCPQATSYLTDRYGLTPRPAPEGFRLKTPYFSKEIVDTLAAKNPKWKRNVT